jgi:hypothetical protein
VGRNERQARHEEDRNQPYAASGIRPCYEEVPGTSSRSNSTVVSMSAYSATAVLYKSGEKLQLKLPYCSYHYYSSAGTEVFSFVGQKILSLYRFPFSQIIILLI